MNKIYIAGPMSGHEDFNKAAFFEAETKFDFRKLTPINPAILPNGLTQGQYMDICFAMIRAADTIYLLKGYEKSKGR
ncbi:hypothetical protein V039C_0063 [Vibrio phage V039C]|nr:hypothetical protein V039C_0063 [Vibrio phage V039C]QJD54587.1 hypothetical protein [Vibrio phage phiV039C]